MKYLLLFVCILFGIKTQCQVPETSNEEVAFGVVENVPVYKGCDESMSNEKKRKCMSDEISELVSANFNRDIATQLNIPSGPVRISIMFKINTEGIIENIQARSQYQALEEEAIRVIKLIPQMKPGHMRGKPVVVPYSLPVLFNVEEESEVEENKTFPVYRGCNENSKYEVLQNCTTERIMDFVKVNTTIDVAEKLFPTDNSTQFQANFVIDKKGKIKDIEVKAHKREMAALVIHALKQLPKMKAPGTINGKPTDVPFSFLMTIYFD